AGENTGAATGRATGRMAPGATADPGAWAMGAAVSAPPSNEVSSPSSAPFVATAAGPAGSVDWAARASVDGGTADASGVARAAIASRPAAASEGPSARLIAAVAAAGRRAAPPAAAGSTGLAPAATSAGATVVAGTAARASGVRAADAALTA